MRTGAEYRQALRDGRRVWVMGEGLVEDVTTHPATRAMADEYVAWYDLHLDPAWAKATILHPLTLTCVLLLAVAAAWLEPRLENAPEFPLGLLDVLDSKRDMRQRWILFDAESDRGHSFGSDQMDGRRAALVADEHPETRNARDIGAARVRLQAKDAGVKAAGVLQFRRGLPDANAVMMQFDHFNGHRPLP